MPEILNYSFMRRAFIVGNIVGIIAPLIGVFLSLKRLSLIGHTLSHIALAGAAVGLAFGIYPVGVAVVFAAIAGLGIERLKNKYKDYAELSLSIVLATGLGIMVLVVSFSDKSAGIFSYLFGSISLVTERDLMVILPLGLLTAGVVFVFYYGFFFLSFNEEEAELAGVPVKFLNPVFTVLTAFTVALSMRIIGGLLISSLIILPVATGIQLGRSFRETIVFSIIGGLVAVNLGLVVSFYFDLAPGGVIIMVSVFILLMVLIFKRVSGVIE